MKGLLRNHYYKILSGLRILLIFILLSGALILLFGGGEDLLTAFLCLSVIAFPFISSIAVRKSGGGKWDQYILSLPVRRYEIVKSVFITQLIAILIGSAISMALFLTSFAIHGFMFYRYVDVLLLFSSAIGTSLIMNAIFLPISYLDSSDRIEAVSIISLIIAVAAMTALITVINIFLEKPSNIQLAVFGVGILILSSAAFVLSYFLTVGIYSKKDC